MKGKKYTRYYYVFAWETNNFRLYKENIKNPILNLTLNKIPLNEDDIKLINTKKLRFLGETETSKALLAVLRNLE